MRINRTIAIAAAGAIMAISLAGPASAISPVDKASNDTESTGITVSLDSLTPVVPTPTDTLQLAGSVTNTSNSTIEGISVDLRISQSAISDRTQIARMTAGTEAPNTYGVSGGNAIVKTKLTPGSSAVWNLSLPMANLGLGNTGVYGLRVDARAEQDSEQADSTQTFIPWFPNPKLVKPTKVVWLWPITNWPDQNANLVFLNDRTPQEVLPGGRLDRLLNLGISGGGQVEWVMDPQLLASVNGMIDGYQVAGNEGTVIAGSSPQAATDWLAKARTGLASASVGASAYAFPDVTALTRAKMPDEVVQATTSAPEIVSSLLSRPVTSNLGWPAGNRTDTKTLSLLQKTGIRNVILDRSALVPAENDTGDISSAVIRTESGPLSAILTDRALSGSLGSSTSSAQDALLARQRFMAEAGVLTATSQSSNRIVAIGPDPRWDPNPAVVTDILAALKTSPFMRSTTLTQLLSDTPKDVPRTLAPMTAGGRRAALSPSYLKRISETQDNLEIFSSILNEPGTITEKYSNALLRATSGAWRVERGEGSKLLDSIDAELSTEMGQVRVLSGGVKNFSSETGEIPITISNDLAVPVTVGMTLTGNPPIRLTAQKFAPLVIPANRKVSTQISAQVRGNGELTAKVQLTNATGVPYGEPSQVTLRSSAYANAATWVVVVAFLLLTLLLLVNSIRRRRQRALESPDDGGNVNE